LSGRHHFQDLCTGGNNTPYCFKDFEWYLTTLSVWRLYNVDGRLINEHGAVSSFKIARLNMQKYLAPETQYSFTKRT
jgi:hypothetical protein